MSFSEVNRLRKSGQLDKAFEMAMRDLENDRCMWSYRALFWVLYDKSKLCLDNKDTEQARELFMQMQVLFPNMDENEADSPAINSLNYLEGQLMPHAPILKQADQASRDNQTVGQAFETVKKILDDKTITPTQPQQTTIGWILYRYAKHKLEKGDTKQVRVALSRYFQLEVEKPSLLHSSILRVAVDLETQYRQDFKFTVFLQMWGFENLTEDDWKPYKTEDGNQLPSLVEKAIGRYCKELTDDKITAVPEQFIRLMEQARSTFQRNGNLEFNYARMLAASGETEQAIAAYKRTTELLPQAYVWRELAGLIADKQIRQAILCKIILMQRDEQFLGNIRLQLAALLIEQSDYPAAKRELETYHTVRQGKGWEVKSPYYELAARIPAGTQPSPSNKNLYHTKLAQLNTFLYPDAKTTVAFSNGETFNNNRGKKRVKLTAPDGRSIQISPNRLPRQPKNQPKQPYYFYTVKYAKTKRGIDPLEITPLETQEGLRHFIQFSGPVSIRTNRDGKPFGFVGDCYIHQSMLTGLTNGAQLHVLAVRNQDGRFSAIAIL